MKNQPRRRQSTAAKHPGFAAALLVALITIAATATFGILSGALVTHRGEDIIGAVPLAQDSLDSQRLSGLTSADILEATGWEVEGTTLSSRVSGTVKVASITSTGVSALPACNSSNRGQQSLLQGSGSVEDTYYICKRKADSSYVWGAITAGTEAAAVPAGTVAGFCSFSDWYLNGHDCVASPPLYCEYSNTGDYSGATGCAASSGWTIQYMSTTQVYGSMPARNYIGVKQ